MHRAVILMNLGGPNSLEAVQPFLFNLFNDPAIIRLPNPFRYLIAKLISSRRAPLAKEIYKKIGNQSPILANTLEQATALENKLGKGYKVFVCMRYWHPFTEEVIEQVKNYKPEEVILLPLYPQFSTTTTGSSFKRWHNLTKNEGWKTFEICCFYHSPLYIEAQTRIVLESYYKILQETKKAPHVLFSAHGLPEKIIKQGDPYQAQIEQTCQNILNYARDTHEVNLNSTVCYQSRVGPLKWIGPSTEEVIQTHCLHNPQSPLMVVPIAFVSEHSETLVELDMEYKELAIEKGLEHYYRVPTLSCDKVFIEALAQEIHKIQHKGCRIKMPCNLPNCSKISTVPLTFLRTTS